MTSFQFTTMSIPTVKKDQSIQSYSKTRGRGMVLAVHERGEIRACESVKVGGRHLRNPVAPEDCMIEKQTALYKSTSAVKCLGHRTNFIEKVPGMM